MAWHCGTVHRAIPHGMPPCHTTLHSTVSYYMAWHRAIPLGMALWHRAPCHTTWHGTIPYYMAWHCAILHGMAMTGDDRTDIRVIKAFGPCT